MGVAAVEVHFWRQVKLVAVLGQCEYQRAVAEALVGDLDGEGSGAAADVGLDVVSDLARSRGVWERRSWTGDGGLEGKEGCSGYGGGSHPCCQPDQGGGLVSLPRSRQLVRVPLRAR